MKILLNKEKSDKIKKKMKEKYKKATAGCNQCPCCGTNDKININIKIDFYSILEKLPTRYKYKYNIYNCNCGAIWKSKLYPYTYYHRKTDSSIYLCDILHKDEDKETL